MAIRGYDDRFQGDFLIANFNPASQSAERKLILNSMRRRRHRIHGFPDKRRRLDLARLFPAELEPKYVAQILNIMKRSSLSN